MTKGNEAAYPASASWREDSPEIIKVEQEGMTKREMFAAMAMQGIMASSNGWPDGNPQHMDEAARRAVNAADALIKQLNSSDK